jgi:hypothetical protein
MTTEKKSSLTRQLLVKLSNVEALLPVGDVVLVQPHIDEMRTTTAISVPGYDWQQINLHLRWMCQCGLISSGTSSHDAPEIGIHFSHLTPTGRRALWRHNPFSE